MAKDKEPAKSKPGKKPGTPTRPLTGDEEIYLGELRNRLRTELERVRKNGGDDSLFEALGTMRTVEGWAGLTRGSANHKFRPHNITQIEKFLQLIERKTHYQYLAEALRQKPHNFRAIQQYEGEYFFFRYRPDPDPDSGGCVYSAGTLTIKFDAAEAEASFQQCSGNYDRNRHNQRAEHNGYVFMKRGKLFFAGRRDNVMRLGIVNLPEGEDPERSFMAGLVMSIADEDEVPFSAKVLLVPATNKTLLGRLAIDASRPTALKVAENNFLTGVRAKNKDVAFLRLTYNKAFLSED